MGTEGSIPRYRLLDAVNWLVLNGQRVIVQVSAGSLVLEQKDGTLINIAKAMRPGPAKAAATNGPPELRRAPVTPDVTDDPGR
jgi:hypothetical protein